MRGRIHTLQNEIKTIENMMESLSGPMLELALEELRNMQFEMDMLNRGVQKSNNGYLAGEVGLHEVAVHGW
jgi:hypothetical protein